MSVGESSAPLPLAGSSQSEALVCARSEAKYRVARHAAASLREQLAERLTAYHHSVPPGMIAGGSLRHITTTVYFDTARRDLCRAALHSPLHLKVRARLYRDEPAPASPMDALVWIELKERDGLRSRKRRAPLEQREAGRWFAALALEDPLLAQRVCDASIAACDEPRAIALLADLAQMRVALSAPLLPSCLVRYRREAFQDACGTLRVTLDENVAAYAAPSSPFEAGALEPDALGPPAHVEPWCVLEIKTTGEMPSWLESLLSAHGARATEYSKLVMASHAVHGAL